MKIIPKRGLSINNVHAREGVPVECEDSLAKELILLDVARRAPAEAPAVPPVVHPSAPAAVETASAPPATETAAVSRIRAAKKRRV